MVQPLGVTLIWKLYRGQWINQGERGAGADDVGTQASRDDLQLMDRATNFYIV